MSEPPRMNGRNGLPEFDDRRQREWDYRALEIRVLDEAKRVVLGKVKTTRALRAAVMELDAKEGK